MAFAPGCTVAVPLPEAAKLKSLPLPESVTRAGPASELSETISDPVRLPPAEGVNLTLIVQFAAETRLAGQLLVCEKSPLLVPVIPMDEIVSVALPVFSSKIGSGSLEFPTDNAAKLSVDGIADR